MTFVDDQMAVCSYTVVHNTPAGQTLNERDINHAAEFPSSTSNVTDRLRIHIEKFP